MRIIFFIVAILAVIAPYASSLGVVSDYLANNTIILDKGQSAFHGVRIQNPSDGPINVKITYPSEFIEILDYKEVYTIPPKTNFPLIFNVSLPDYSKPGEEHTVSYTVHQLSGAGPGVPIMLKIAKSFIVKERELPKKDSKIMIYIFLAAVLIVALFMIKIKPKSKIKDNIKNKKASRRKTGKKKRRKK